MPPPYNRRSICSRILSKPLIGFVTEDDQLHLSFAQAYMHQEALLDEPEEMDDTLLDGLPPSRAGLQMFHLRAPSTPEHATPAAPPPILGISTSSATAATKPSAPEDGERTYRIRIRYGPQANGNVSRQAAVQNAPLRDVATLLNGSDNFVLKSVSNSGEEALNLDLTIAQLVEREGGERNVRLALYPG